MNPELNLDEITRLLLIPTSSRTTSDSDYLVRLTQCLKFFNDMPAHIHIACVQTMKVAYFQKGEVVFHHGDAGDSFCIILKGCVEIMVPGFKLSKKLLEESKAATEDDLVQIATLDAGATFGELALLNNEPRAATVKAKTSVALATLYKDNYDRLLRAQYDGQLKEKVKFLRSFPFFNDWTQLSLSKLTYFFIEIPYKRGDIVFTEGAAVHDVYFIKSGEFELRKIIHSEARLLLNSAKYPRLRAGKDTQSRPIFVKTGRDVMGFDEAITGSCYECTCRCRSDTGVVWAISREVPTM